MRNQLGFVLAIALIASAPAFAQPQERHEEGKQEAPKRAVEKNPPRANGGHIPPAPERRADPNAGREAHKFEDGRASDRPHVANDHWYGHEAPNDPRFHIDHPFPHGHFAHFGASYRYRVVRYDIAAHRFWFAGGGFEIAAWDWAQCADWCWNCGADDFVVYEDSDHVGWYLVYNIHTGVYVHAQFLG